MFVRCAASMVVLSGSASAALLRGSIDGGHVARQSASVNLDTEIDSMASAIDAHVVSLSQLLLEIVAPNSSSTLRNSSTHGNASALENRTSKLQKQQDIMQHLFSSLKSSIATTNKGEVDDKESANKRVEQIEKNLAERREKLNSTNLSAFNRELLENRTKMDEVELSYWKRSRELQHSMFHSRLKVTHGLMSRVQEVLGAYNELMSKGKLSPERVKSLHNVVANMPVKAVPHTVSNTTSKTAVPHVAALNGTASNTTSKTAVPNVAASNGTAKVGPHVEAANSTAKAQPQGKKQV